MPLLSQRPKPPSTNPTSPTQNGTRLQRSWRATAADRDAYLDLRQFFAWCKDHDRGCSAYDGPTSSASLGTWKHAGALGRPSPVGCARWRASIATPSRKACSRARQRRMFAGLDYESHTTGGNDILGGKSDELKASAANGSTETGGTIRGFAPSTAAWAENPAHLEQSTGR